MTTLTDPDDQTRAFEQRRRLRQMQAVATGLLMAAALLWVLARGLENRHPAWGYVRAFAEAAMIGGLADWFAVVALFRRPLGLPIWHTAILPTRKDEVARNVGEFVEGHLVTPAALREQVPRARLASRLADVLQREDAARAGGDWLAALSPQLLDALDDPAVAAWLAERVLEALGRLDAPALGRRGLHRLADEGSHQRLLDAVARSVADWLADPDHVPALADFLAQAMNIDNPMVKSMLKAAAPKAAAGLVGLLDDLQARADHPWRAQLDRWVAQWLTATEDNPVWDARLRHWQTSLLEQPDVRGWIEALWPGLKARLRERLAQDQARISGALARLVAGLGRQLAADTVLQDRLDHGLAEAAATLAAEHRGAAARFLEAQLARWSAEEMSDKVELAIGRDLQFIRVNGTLVGGLIGLLLHALARW